MAIINKDVDYFAQFAIGAGYALEAAKLMHEMFSQHRIDTSYISKIKDIEHEADTHRHKTGEALNRAFITAIDREDINVILNETDNIVDSIDSVGKTIYMMRVDEGDRFCVEFSDLVIKACEQMVLMFNEMKKFKKSNDIVSYCIEINNIEEQGDKLLREAIHELFVPGADPLHVMKMQEIYKCLEDALNNCEDVADIVQGIMTTKT